MCTFLRFIVQCMPYNIPDKAIQIAVYWKRREHKDKDKHENKKKKKQYMLHIKCVAFFGVVNFLLTPSM